MHVAVLCLILSILDNMYYIRCVCILYLKSLSHVQLFATPQTVARRSSLSMEFSGKNTGVGSHSLRDLPNPRIEPRSPPLQAQSFCLSHQGSLLAIMHCKLLFTQLLKEMLRCVITLHNFLNFGRRKTAIHFSGSH